MGVAQPGPVYCMRAPLPMAGVTGGSGLMQPFASQPTPLTFGVFGLTSGATSASTKAVPAAVDCATMTPAFAQELEFDW